MLLYLESQRKYDEFVEQLKMVLLGHDPDRFYELIFPQRQVRDESDIPTEGPVTFDFSQSMSGEEAMQVLAGLQPELMQLGIDDMGPEME